MLMLLILAAGPATPAAPARFDAGCGLRSLAFLPDGRVAVAGWTGAAHLWDASGGSARRLGEAGQEYSHVSVNPAGDAVLGCGMLRLALWDAASGKERWAQPVKYEGGAAWGFQGKWVVTYDHVRNALVLRSGKSGELVQRIPCGSAHGAFASDPARHRLAVFEHGGGLTVYDPFTGDPVWSARGHMSRPHRQGALAYHPRGGWLATGGAEGTVRLWDAATGRPGRVLALGERACTALGANADGLLAAAFEGGTMAVYDTAAGRRIAGWQEPHAADHLSFTPDGKTLAGVGGRAAQVMLWDPRTGLRRGGRPERAIPGLRVLGGGEVGAPIAPELANASPRPVVSHDGRLAAEGGKAGITIRDARGEALQTLRGGDGPAEIIGFSPDGSRLAALFRAGGLCVWDTASGKLLHRGKTGPARGAGFCRFSTDGRHLLFSADEAGTALIDLSTGNETVLAPGARFSSYPRPGAWSPDGRAAVALGFGVRVWSPLRPDAVRTWGVAPNFSADAAFSADGRLVALYEIGVRPGVGVWEVASGGLVRRVPVTGGGPRRIAFTSDGRLIAGSPGGGCVLLNDPRAGGGGGGRYWERLAGDAADAHAAMWELAARPASALALLPGKLIPPAAPTEKAMARLVADLDSDDFEVRQKAEDTLRDSLRASAPAMYRALRAGPPLEARKRLERLLAGWESSPEALRLGRALMALECIGPAAVPELSALARKAGGTPVGDEARAALARMGR